MQTAEKRTGMNANDAPFIVVSFPVQGQRLPADHGYALYSAITHHVPSLHNASWLGVELISGIPWDKGMITLPTHGAKLHLRLLTPYYTKVLPLAGKRLAIAGYSIRLEVPLARSLTPATSLYARIVTIKKFTESTSFLDAAYRQLATLGINARLELPNEEHTRCRRIITIRGKKVVGFSLVVHNLSGQDSITLQSHGLGGRRAMGCGLFNPIVRMAY